MNPALNLPEGRAGQVLALAAALAVAAVVWLAAISPALDWYQDRQDTLATMQAEAAHMRALQAGLPALRAAITASATQNSGTILLAGDSDEIAAANLQTMLNGLAGDAGATLDSVETVPVLPAGGLRRIGVAVSMSATWPVLVAFMTAIESARPRMIVDDLSVTAESTPDGNDDATLQTSFTVSAFRGGGS